MVQEEQTLEAPKLLKVYVHKIWNVSFYLWSQFQGGGGMSAIVSHSKWRKSNVQEGTL